MLPGFLALALGSCASASDNATPCLPEDLLALAARHYRAHEPPEVLKRSGGRLTFIVDDLEDSWDVSVGPAGAAGGGLTMFIRKSDRRVEISPVRWQ